MTGKTQVIVVTSGGLGRVALLLAKLQADGIAAAELAAMHVVHDETPKMKLPEIKEFPPLKPWVGHTGKKKAQWKQETYGRKRK